MVRQILNPSSKEIEVKYLILFLSLLSLSEHGFASEKVEYVRVYKSERRLELISKNEEIIKSYKIMLGRNPVGHKEKEGDNKTPEGTYTLDIKNSKSNFFKSLHISYPNFKDKLKAKLRGDDPGGSIMLHGLPNDFTEMNDWLNSVGLGDLSDDLVRLSLLQFDWTNGCIAVTDEEITEIYDHIDVPTKIVIKP